MSDGRLPSGLLVAAMLRQANDSGGFGVVRARGDESFGTILVAASEAGETLFLERGLGPDGATALIESRPGAQDDSPDDYWKRRRARDPDLWVIELDVPAVKRLVAETILGN